MIERCSSALCLDGKRLQIISPGHLSAREAIPEGTKMTYAASTIAADDRRKLTGAAARACRANLHPICCNPGWEIQWFQALVM